MIGKYFGTMRSGAMESFSAASTNGEKGCDQISPIASIPRLSQKPPSRAAPFRVSPFGGSVMNRSGNGAMVRSQPVT